MTTLADLQKAIARVEVYERAPLHEALEHGVGWAAAERDAWRTAFEWHVSLIQRHGALAEEMNTHLADYIAIDREEEDGMRLIEKLR